MSFITLSELASHLPLHSRLLGLDLGEKTIGLALSDVSRTIASPLDTIRRGKFSKDAEILKTLCSRYEIAALILGYPVNMDASHGPRAQSVRAFAANVEKILLLPIVLWDERMSTMAVTRTMLEADLSRKRRAELVDKMAASYILQGALDYLKQHG